MGEPSPGRQTVSLNIVEIPVEAPYDLRRRVLRAGRADLDVTYPEDRDPATFHLGIVDPRSTVVAVGTFAPVPTQHRPGAVAWQLRGMAVEPDRQGDNLGRMLLDDAVTRLRDRGASVLWAHARDSAIGFYKRMGWVVYGGGFVEGDLQIPHHIMVFDLPGADPTLAP